MSTLIDATVLALKAALAVLPGFNLVPIQALPHGPDRSTPYPSVVLEPGAGRWQVTLWQRDDVRDQDGELVEVGGGAYRVVQIGVLSGEIRLWCAGETPKKRGPLHDAVLNAFAGDEQAPGRLVVSLPNVPVVGLATSLTAMVGVFCDGDAEFREELVFAERRWSYIDLPAEMPVFGLASEPVVEQMVAFLTEDLDTPVTEPADIADLSESESVLVNEDGSLSTPP